MTKKKISKEEKKGSSTFKPRKIKIKMVGIGGGGTSIVSEIAQSLKGVSFLVADTDSRIFKRVRNKKIKVFQFGKKLLGGMGTGLNPEIAHRAAEAEKERIAQIFKDQDLSILIASLGGGVGSGAGPVFATAARTQKTLTLGIFTLPFSFEGEKKMKIAREALEKLREDSSAILFIPNEKIFQIIDKKTPLKKALSSLNKMFVDWLRELIEVIQKPNLINIDFADLRTCLKTHGKILFFAQATSQGANRAEEVQKKLFENPIFARPPQRVTRILFNIAGGKDLGLKEVAQVSNAIAKLNPRAKIIFGVSQTPKYKGKIKITLLAVSDGEKKKREEIKREEKEKKPKKENKAKKEKKEKIKKEKEVSQKKDKIRRTALEVQKAKKEAEEREWVTEAEWEIPTFLRKKGT